MKCYSVTSEKLQNFQCFTWISADTAVVASIGDNCLYEVVVAPNLQGIRATKISQPFASAILTVAALIPGCGASPSAASNAPTSQANQKSPFQLSRASAQSSDFGQSVIAVGCADGTVTFMYADVMQLGGSGQKVNVRRTKAHNLKEFVTTADDCLPVTSMCLTQPRGSTLLVGTETGYLLSFALTGGQFSFKQLLRSDIGAPIHSILSLSKTHVALVAKNVLQIISLNRPNAPEVVYKIPDGQSITCLACNSEILALGVEHSGIVFYDFLQNIEISTSTAPPGDAIISLSCSPSSEEFLAGTRKGAILCYRNNGVLREVGSTFDSISESQQFPGGILDLQYSMYGGIFLAICHSGLCYGSIFPQRISTGSYQFEPIDDCKIKITDNILQMNDIYQTPEPITGLYLSTSSERLRDNAASASLKNQWMQEPLRTQSFTESVQKGSKAQEQGESNIGNVQMVGGVQFGTFNFEKQEELNAKQIVSQSEYSPVCKSALYLRHSVCFSSASDKYLFIQDISGEGHVCLLQNLSLVYTIYNGQFSANQFSFNDQVMTFTEGSVLRVTETPTGQYIIRQLVHQRRIQQVAVSNERPETAQASEKVNIQLGDVFGGMIGQGAQPSQSNQQQQNRISTGLIALLDASCSVFVHQLQPAAFYVKHSQTSQLFNQLNLQTRAMSVSFPPNSQILTVLALDSQNLQQPSSFLGATDNPDHQTRLRCILVAQASSQDVALPPPIFISPIAISISQLLKQAASISFEEQLDNSSRQIAQFKLLSRQTTHQITRITLTVRQNQNVSSMVNASNCIVSLLGGSCQLIVPLPEFPFLVEQYQKKPDVTQRLCRYLQQPALWSFLCGYARLQGDHETLRLALAAVGQVPKAVHESGAHTVEVLVDQGKIGAAVQQCCDLWDFDRARAIIAKDRRFGSLLVYLRRQLYLELGSIADEKQEPWLGLAKEFGEKANEAVLSMIEK